MASGWKINIVGHGVKSAAEFLANPYNFKIHTEQQHAVVKASLDELGWIDEVIENVQTGHLVNGHERVSLALREGDETPVPYKLVDLSPAQEKKAIAFFDEMVRLAGKDKEKLAELFADEDLKTGDAALLQFFSEVAAKEGIIPPNVTFKEYDESVENEVEWLECPECGHRWPK